MSSTSDNPRFSALLAKQAGVFTSAQATACRVGRATLSRRAAAEWTRVFPGVYVAGEPSFEQRLRAACLWAGAEAVLSHGAAGRLLGLAGCGEAEPALTVPPQQHKRPPGIRVHRAHVPAEDRRPVKGLPCTTAARTLVDLAGTLSEEDLAIAVEDAWRRKIAALDWVERRLRQLGSRGRPGTKALRRVLDDCWDRKRPLDSALEVRVWRLLQRSALPTPVPCHAVDYDDDEGEPGRIDFAYPDARLAIEADGFEAHSQRAVFEKDRVRLSRLAAAGWRVVHVTWEQLGDPERLLKRIARALGA
jgi:hypothetical protein